MQGGRLTGKTGNFFVDREFLKFFNKKRFQFVLNVLHKVIYLYIKLWIPKFPPYFVISVYQEKLHFRILDKKYFKTLKTHCINCYSLETIFLMTGNYFRRWKRPPWTSHCVFMKLWKGSTRRSLHNMSYETLRCKILFT